MKLSQEFSLQTQSLFSVSPEGVTEPSPIEEVVSSASVSLEKNYALTRIPPISATPHGASELKDEVGLSSEKRNFESCSSFSKQTSLSLNTEEVSFIAVRGRFGHQSNSHNITTDKSQGRNASR